MILYISNQKPFIKKVKFSYIKKKILKRFFISVSLNKKNSFNFFMYMLNFYNYFFHIYYQKCLKYNRFENSLILYIDNIQFSLKITINKTKRRKLNASLICVIATSILFKYLNNMFLIKVKN